MHVNINSQRKIGIGETFTARICRMASAAAPLLQLILRLIHLWVRLVNRMIAFGRWLSPSTDGEFIIFLKHFKFTRTTVGFSRCLE